MDDIDKTPPARFMPTPEGLVRFTRTMGFYRMHALDTGRYPCRCTARCAAPCNGDCGCPACAMQRIDSRLQKRA